MISNALASHQAQLLDTFAKDGILRCFGDEFRERRPVGTAPMHHSVAAGGTLMIPGGIPQIPHCGMQKFECQNVRGAIRRGHGFQILNNLRGVFRITTAVLKGPACEARSICRLMGRLFVRLCLEHICILSKAKRQLPEFEMLSDGEFAELEKWSAKHSGQAGIRTKLEINFEQRLEPAPTNACS
jgi:hypothetical protein